MTHATAQNIYDNASLFAAYTKLARSQQGLDGVPEWPCLREMLLVGGIQGRSFLDLGSGYGWVCRWARGEGAARVTGMDVSNKMVSKAREMDARVCTSNGTDCADHASISYAVQDLETVELGADCFDVVFSSLTFHYVENVRRVFRQVRGCLSPKGRFVFSVEHPIRTAPVDFEPEWKMIDGHIVWPLSGYKEEGQRRREWLGVPGVQKYHRTMETYVTMLIESGFVLTGLKEWAPSEEDVKRGGWVAARGNADNHPGGVDGRHRPYFLLVSAVAASLP